MSNQLDYQKADQLENRILVDFKNEDEVKGALSVLYDTDLVDKMVEKAKRYKTKGMGEKFQVVIADSELGFTTVAFIVEKAKKLDSKMGVYAYVYNLDIPDFSECGCIFLEKHQVGVNHDIDLYYRIA